MIRPDARLDSADTVELELGEECEAFLAGCYVDWLVGQGLAVPVWARLNCAAHADLASVRRHLPTPAAPSRPQSWAEVELLVNAVVVAGIPAADFETVQRAVLVPLEFELMCKRMSPGAVLDRVCDAIY